jgi:hypothetical protein
MEGNAVCAKAVLKVNTAIKIAIRIRVSGIFKQGASGGGGTNNKPIFFLYLKENYLIGRETLFRQ